MPNDGLLLLDAGDNLAVLVSESYIFLLLLVDDDDLRLQLALKFGFLLFVLVDHFCFFIIEFFGLLVNELFEFLIDLLQFSDLLCLHLTDMLKITHCLLVLLAFIDVISQIILILLYNSISFFLVLALELLDSSLLFFSRSLLLACDVLLQSFAIDGVLVSKMADFVVCIIE